MGRGHRKLLRKLRPYLSNNLLINGEVCDELISISALNAEEAELLDHEKCNRDKVKRMVLALSSKDEKVYKSFKECLKTTKNDHVLEEIEKEEKEFLTEQNVNSEQIKRALLKNVSVDIASFTPLQTIQDILLYDESARNDTDFVEDILDDNWLVREIEAVFPKSKFGESTSICSSRVKKRGRSNKQNVRTEEGFFGIKPSDVSEQQFARQRQESECSLLSDTEAVTDDIDKEEEKRVDEPCKDKLKLSIHEFYEWVKGVLSDHGSDTSAAERFKEDDIDGLVFNELSPTELEVKIPKLGQRKKVEMMWRDYNVSPRYSKQPMNEESSNRQKRKYSNQTIPQPLRPFDCLNANKHKYKQYALANIIDHRRGNPLSPVHKFLQLESENITSSKEALNFAKEVIKFGSACMNDKVNGTVHFGITSERQIKGCKIDFKLVERKITQTIRHLFYDGQISIALNCIRPPQFIEVVQEETNNDALYVIEVDVVPSTKFVEDFAFFLKQSDKEGPKSALYRYENDVKSMNAREIESFMNGEKSSLFENRKKVEETNIVGSNDQGYQKLKNFLCCGDDYFEPSVYPILVLKNTQDCQFHKATFIKHVEWRAIYDFSPSDEQTNLQNHLQKKFGMVFNTNFIEDFDSQKVTEQKVRQIMENLKSSPLPNWIYCDGPWQECQVTKNPSSWKMERSNSFRKAVEFYSDNIPCDRGRVLIPLFGHGGEVLVEAAEEMFIKFRNNCLVVAETETLANSLKDALLKRNVFEVNSDVDDFFVVGLPWKHVCEALEKLVKCDVKVAGFELQRSTGVTVEVPGTFKKELCDLDVLFANECEEISRMDEVQKKELQTNIGEEFYKGNAVSWQNFYFQDQVLLRKINTDLVDSLLNAVKSCGSFNQPVKQVIVYHQPGAGGSTSAKHAMWLIKNKFRCCVVKNFTKQTTEQICRLRMYEEEDRNRINPVIVLVDLDDDEAVSKLHDELENESQKHSCEIFCVMLILCRVSEKPNKAPSSSVFLKQHLTTEELQWFNDKYEHLRTKHSKNQGCDPQTLLSLNVMKENFNIEAIKKYVEKFVQDPLLTGEHVQVLKYLSFVNHYDIRFQPVPKNSFDPIMGKLDWILHIPQSFRILVNPVPVDGLGGKIPCLRISNHLLTLPVLEVCMKIGTQSESYEQTVGEIAKELLGSKMVNQFSRADFNKRFEKILSSMVKKRDVSHSGGKLLQFSPIIMHLFDTKDFDTAIDILERVYEITDDQMVAQQLARFYAEIKNWNHAYRVIEKAISVLQENAYLIHTCGQVYKLEFESLCKSNMSEDEKIKALHVAQNARLYFREAQRISRAENVRPQNPAGFDGEIRLSIDILKYFFIPEITEICKHKNHHKLVIRKPSPDCACNFINSIEEGTLLAIEALQTEVHQLRLNKINVHGDFFLRLLDGNLLKVYKRDFFKFLSKSNGKSSTECNTVFSFLDATEAEDNRLVELVRHKEDQGTLVTSAQKMRIVLASCIELTLRQTVKIPTTIDHILKLSRIFYEKIGSSNYSITTRCEAHFIMTMTHWPMQYKEQYRDMLCPYPLLIQVLESWKKINDEKANKASHDKIICYLSNSKQFPSLVRSENAKKSHLFVMRGRICSNGTEVEIKPHQFRAVQASPIKIPTLYPLKMTTMWNKDEDVVLGFGLYGPKIELYESVTGNFVKLSPRTSFVPVSFDRAQNATERYGNFHLHPNQPHNLDDRNKRPMNDNPKRTSIVKSKTKQEGQCHEPDRNQGRGYAPNQARQPFVSPNRFSPLSVTSPVQSPTHALSMYPPFCQVLPFQNPESFPALTPPTYARPPGNFNANRHQRPPRF